MYLRYAQALRRFLRDRLDLEQSRRWIEDQLAKRPAAFLRILADGVFPFPESPYFKLFRHAGLDYEDVRALVEGVGLEPALERLHDAGVHVALEEFKGRRPIRRGRLEIAVRPEDFDNPLSVRHLTGRTSGSRGASRRVGVDLALLAYEAAHLYCYVDTFGLMDRPLAIWRGVPPVGSGINLVLRYAKIGKRVDRWFAQNRPRLRPATLRHWLTTQSTLRASRLLGWRLPAPEYVHQDDAVRISRWLAKQVAAGTPAHLDTNPSSGVRLCLAAQAHGLDISGTFFRFGGEPYTAAKEAVVAASGCRATCQYAMAEIAWLGRPCAAPSVRDDVHVMTDKVALIEREKPVGRDGETVRALVITTVLSSCSKLMINVESGDHGRLERRRCGCPFDALGLDQHLSGVRSYEKLTSEGMSYLGHDLLRLVEEVLPDRFGGHPTDYQLVEEEERGIPKVSLMVSPRVGEVEERAVLAAVYEALGAAPGGRLMSNFWEEARTVRVIRGEPHATHSAKILPLHVIDG